MRNSSPRPFPLTYLANLIFWSRWLQAPLYVGLIVVQCVYVYQFTLELWHLVVDARQLSESSIMLQVLGLIDVVMIANLLVMVVVGGYETFVSRLHIESHPDQPDWLDHVNAGTMKIKLSMALVGISSIHLLKSFINADQLNEKTLLWQVVIHMTFLISTVTLAWSNKITNADKG